MRWSPGSLLALFSDDLAIDLGTANSLVYCGSRGIVVSEPSIIAVNQKTGRVVAVGGPAKAMLGRTPGNIILVRPLKDGVIADFEYAEQMLNSFIKQARRWRKMVGGGMRQAGILAAAGLYALDHHSDLLGDDHAHAELIAKAASSRYPGKVSHRTNMIFVDIDKTEMAQLIERMAAAQIRVRGPRWVTHLDISADDANRVSEVLRSG